MPWDPPAAEPIPGPPVQKPLAAARQQPVAYAVDETGAPTGNATASNPMAAEVWQWVNGHSGGNVCFLQGLSRSACRQAATEPCWGLFLAEIRGE